MKSAVTYDGKLVAVSLNSEFFGIVYNKDLLAEAGYNEPPKALSAFKQLCENLKANGVTPLSFGFKEGWILDQFISFPFHDAETPLRVTGEDQMCTMVPHGCTNLRITYLPRARK